MIRKDDKKEEEKKEVKVVGEKKIIVDRNPLTMAAADRTPAGSGQKR